ncbi:preprotein translocase subunit SecE [Terricaulis sp.]|uniref:preprotein translocase subunit SecE n=1 Tax=Terricaulis sp. TaxID=2768686 RepID=UPI002AC492E8|nr:preprotein translocase subunit SecE [Terricaulis sp.]MDZ4691491.1 preprotein translocase subunit SecE [Terricaulis sp.]
METADQDSEPRRRGGPFRFFGEVRAEARKVTWATRQEVTVSTIMVVIFGVVAAIFFFTVDSILRFGIGLLLNSLG